MPATDDPNGENLWAKWLEISAIEIYNSGVQYLEGYQKFNGIITQQFKFDYFVRTFECLRIPAINFDGIVNERGMSVNRTYLKAFHFKFDSTSCTLNHYKCSYHLWRRDKRTNATDFIYQNQPHITIYKSSGELTASIDQIIEYEIMEGRDIQGELLTHQYRLYENATCTHNNTNSRQFTICAQNCAEGSPPLSKVVTLNIFTAKRLNDTTYQILLPFTVSDVFPRYISIENTIVNTNNKVKTIKQQIYRIPQVNSLHIDDIKPDNYEDYTIQVFPYNSNDYYTFEKFYRIITDQYTLCQVECREHCVKEKRIYFISNDFESHQLTLFCPKCDFAQMNTELSAGSIPVRFLNRTPNSEILQLDLAALSLDST
ncbi:unnamed protein product, partial [Didymodactylos carnosus]